MSRPVRVLLISSASIALAAFATACGSERIKVPKSDPAHAGAVLFSQRCSGCHTLAYAATHGSASNPRSALPINGPNFDIRCERPLTRVLYAIENGGFSGAYMPQNVVVGQDATEVAQFVSQYAGRQAPKIPDQPVCGSTPVGSVPPLVSTTASATTAPKATAPAPAPGSGRESRPGAKPTPGKARGAAGKPARRPKAAGKQAAAPKKTNAAHY